MIVDFPYSDLVGMLPLERIVEALDDDRDGEADAAAWADVLERVGERLDDIFGSGTTAAEGVSTAYAQKVFACELLFGRRGFSGDTQNPWTAQANAIEKRLRAHATGAERPLLADDGGTVITEPALMHLPDGGLIA